MCSYYICPGFPAKITTVTPNHVPPPPVNKVRDWETGNIENTESAERSLPSYPQLRRMELRAAAYLSILLALLLACATAPPAAATKFTVGDSQAWNPNVNYTKWINKHKPFYVGDWLGP